VRKAQSVAECVALYDEIRTKRLAEWDASTCGWELYQLGLFNTDRPHADSEDGDLWRAGALRLFLEILDRKTGFARVQTAVTSAILNLESVEGDMALIERWLAEQAKRQKSKSKKLLAQAPVVHGLDALLAWSRRRSPTVRLDRLLEAATSLERRKPMWGNIRFARFDASLAALVAEIPSPHLAWFVRAEWLTEVPLFAKALGERMLRPASSSLATYLEILDDETARRKIPEAGAQLLAYALQRREPPDCSNDALEALLARSNVLPQPVLDAAIAALTPTDVFDFASPHVPDSSPLRKALATQRRSLRDRRWIDFAATRYTGGLVVEMAADPDHPARDEALAILIEREKQRRSDTIDRRAALDDLGNTGHRGALPTLLYAMNDPSIGSAMAITLAAIGKCGTLETIPELEKRLNWTWDSYVTAAITHIQTRARRLTREKILEACNHTDPMIASLARQARDDGDEDNAAIPVLEDALRERGEISA